MKTLTKVDILKKYQGDFACIVYYRGKKESVKYTTNKHIDWNNVHRITVLFDHPKFHHNGKEAVKRAGATYLITG